MWPLESDKLLNMAEENTSIVMCDCVLIIKIINISQMETMIKIKLHIWKTTKYLSQSSFHGCRKKNPEIRTQDDTNSI